MTPFDKVVEKLDGMKSVGQTGNQWVACCPAHKDNRQSLGVGKGKDGKVLLSCYAGCTLGEIVNAMGMTVEELFPKQERGVTIGQLAVKKNLPANWLVGIGLKQDGNRVYIPYYDYDGVKECRPRIRSDVKAGAGTYWGKEIGPIVVYGRWMLGSIEEPLWIVEGETDCWALWHHNLSGIGVPGAKMTKRIELGDLGRHKKVVVWKEPGKAGDEFSKDVPQRLHDLGWDGEIWIAEPPVGVKDPSQLQAMAPDKFVEDMRAIELAAVRWTGPQAKPNPRGVPGVVRRCGLNESPFQWGEFEMTDDGNADRFHTMHGQNVRWVETWKTWLVWDGVRWKRDDALEVYELGRQVVHGIWYESELAPSENQRARVWLHWRNSQAKARITAMLELAKAMCAISHTEFDQHRHLLNVKNGTVDLRTGKFSEARRSDWMTMRSNVVYDVEAVCPTFERFLETVFPIEAGKDQGNEQLIEFMQRLIGYMATGDTRQAILPIWYGEGSNGKSTLIDVIQQIFGNDYSMSAPPRFLMMKQTERHPTELADLYGKRAVFATESKEGAELDVELIKMLTGDDDIRARRMRENNWQFKPTHKLVLTTNHRPNVRSNDHGIWRRLAEVPFVNRFWGANDSPGPDHLRQDVKLKDRLGQELSGILNWVIRGAVAYYENGIELPNEVKRRTEEYRESQDIIGQFLEECCVVSGNDQDSVSRQDLYDSYQEWIEGMGQRPYSSHNFVGRIRGRDGIREHRTTYARLWLGVKLNPDNVPKRKLDQY